jgi:cob(I)alamin adenosyltransferase
MRGSRAGDGGITRLGDGSRVAKDSPLIEALGEIDELGCVLALAALDLKGQEAGVLRGIQSELMGLSADLAFPKRRRGLLLQAGCVARLDETLRAARRRIPPARGFVLPGGPAASAFCHLARAVARRAERRVAALPARLNANPLALPYLNRLSDLLFVMARVAASRGGRERAWVPPRPK